MRAIALSLTLAMGVSALAPASAQTPAPPASSEGVKSGIQAGLKGAERLLDKVGATPEQKTKIKAILFDAFLSLDRTGDSLKAALPSLVQSLTGPTVDRAGAERARAALVGDVDAGTRVLVNALGNAADVLTPEQRAKLAAIIEKKKS